MGLMRVLQGSIRGLVSFETRLAELSVAGCLGA